MDFCPVVTNVVDLRAFSLNMVVFGLRLTTFVIEVLARRFESRWFDDVCNVGRPPVAGQALSTRWPVETPVAFARSCLCGIETAIAFAGEKWAFLVQFSGAEVMPVSRDPCWGCAVVLLVSTSSCCRASCAKKFALYAQNTPKLAFSGVLGEFFSRKCCFRALWVSVFAEMPLEVPAGRVISRVSSRGIPGEF